jgi:hypothetical protein
LSHRENTLTAKSCYDNFVRALHSSLLQFS